VLRDDFSERINRVIRGFAVQYDTELLKIYRPIHSTGKRTCRGLNYKRSSGRSPTQWDARRFPLGFKKQGPECKQLIPPSALISLNPSSFAWLGFEIRLKMLNKYSYLEDKIHTS
jgi:hypothetical protein